MTSYKVMENFKNFIDDAIKNVRLSTKSNTGREPQVVLGYLEPLEEEQEEKEDFPYIIIRYMNDESSSEAGSINLKLIFGVYSKDTKGWMDVLHLIESLKLAIFKKQVFDFYTLSGAIKSEMPEEQPYPYFFGFMNLTFDIPQVQMEGDVSAWQSE